MKQHFINQWLPPFVFERFELQILHGNMKYFRSRNYGKNIQKRSQTSTSMATQKCHNQLILSVMFAMIIELIRFNVWTGKNWILSSNNSRWLVVPNVIIYIMANMKWSKAVVIISINFLTIIKMLGMLLQAHRLDPVCNALKYWWNLHNFFALTFLHLVFTQKPSSYLCINNITFQYIQTQINIHTPSYEYLPKRRTPWFIISAESQGKWILCARVSESLSRRRWKKYLHIYLLTF